MLTDRNLWTYFRHPFLVRQELGWRMDHWDQDRGDGQRYGDDEQIQHDTATLLFLQQEVTT